MATNEERVMGGGIVFIVFIVVIVFIEVIVFRGNS
jgi:hypothetical protein